ncbi:hypothetical protein [Brochothrix phage BtpYZU04]
MTGTTPDDALAYPLIGAPLSRMLLNETVLTHTFVWH